MLTTADFFPPPPYILRIICGNALIYYDTVTRGHTDVKIVNSSFFNGQNHYQCCEIQPADSGGLSIIFTIVKEVHHAFLVSVTSCNFVNNTGNTGGNMEIKNDCSDLIELNFSIQHSFFFNGTANCGGGLSIRSHGGGSFILTIINSSFTHNFAGIPSNKFNYGLPSGGGVNIVLEVHNKIILKIVASRFLNNAATNGGGFFSYARMEMLKNGGAISNFSMHAVLELKESEFDGNTAIEEGGHGYIGVSLLTDYEGRAFVIVSDCQFKRGSAFWGGAISVICNSNTNLFIDHCTFYKNQASYGGVLGIEYFSGKKHCKIEEQ